jgi:hypothetical protein
MPVTLPPVIIEASGQARAAGGFGNNNGLTFFGPFEIGANLYIVQLESNTIQIAVYKSADQGGTWTSQDVAGQVTSLSQGAFDVAESGGLLYILFVNAANHFQVVQFDTGTDTFGAAGAALTWTNYNSALNIRLLRVTSGDLYAFAEVTNGASTKIQYAVFSGGVWGALTEFTAFIAATTDLLRAVAVDSGDLMHVTYRRFAAGVLALRYSSLTTGGVVSAGTVIDSGGLGGNAWDTGHMAVWGTKLVLPNTDSATGLLAGVWTGTPLAAPVWTFTPVDTLPWAATVTDLYLFSFAIGGTAYLFWSPQDFSPADPADIIDRIYVSSNAGSGWSIPTPFYDEVTNPQLQDPGIDPYLQFIHTMSATLLSSGRFGVTTALEENDLCSGYFLLDAGITIECDNPPDGRVGQAYSHAFPATGGIEPYAFAIIAGALPDGLTLAPNTGIVSGIPTVAGTFDFTVQVTDADDNTADVECSITIATATLSIICDNPPISRVGEAYSHFFRASGGTEPYTFEITDGDLPDGLTLNEDTGEVSGIPTTKGTFTFTVTVTDADDDSADVECSITIRGKCLL